MPNCAEVNCNIRREKGYRLFRFPSINDTRKDVWINNMRRKDWAPNNNSRLCELHFEASQFESNRADQWKKLKPNAVPTLFNVPNPTRLIDPPPRKSLFKMPAQRKLSIRQMELLVEFAEAHRNIALGRCQGPQTSQNARQAWKALVTKLNSVKEGTYKTADQWRRYWIEFKARTKTKAADSRRKPLSTGGGSSKLVPLNIIEERVLVLLGQVAMDEVPEVQTSTNIPTEEIAPASIIYPSSSAILQPNPQNSDLELKTEVERLSETPSPLPPSSSETQDIIAKESQDSDSTRSQALPVIQPEIEVRTKEDRRSRRRSRISRPLRRDPNVPNWAYLELRRIATEERKTSVLEKHLQVEREKVSEMRQIKLQLRELNAIMGKISNSLM